MFLLAAAAATAAATSALATKPLIAHGLPTLRVVAADGTRIQIEPFGANALRVRLRPDGNPINTTLPGALNATAAPWHGFRPQDAWAVSSGATTQLVNGNIEATVDDATGLITFSRLSDGVIVLREVARNYTPPASSPSAATQSVSDSASASDDPALPVLSISFNSSAQESLVGFGEHQQGRLDNKGVLYDMESCLDYGHSHGGEVCLPFVLGATPGIAATAAATCVVQKPGLGCYQDSEQRLYPYQAGAVNQNDLTVEKCVQVCHARVRESVCVGECVRVCVCLRIC
jgi:hypothetical protein